MKCLFYESESHCARHNLAVEEYLFGLADCSRCVILYLWQNDRAVILGKNQDAWAEVNMDAARRSGVQVVRRMTGGGTVFHDLGNLNYTMIFPASYSKKDIVYQMMIGALGKLGVAAFVGGRNDIYIDGYKFSGNAFYTNQNCYLHHGTILVDSDLNMLNAVLDTPSGKLAGRSVNSVQSRVKNIREVVPDITVDKVKPAIMEEYEKWAVAAFGTYPERIQVTEADIGDRLQKYNDPLWNLGNGKKYAYERTAEFDWGNARIAYDQRDGIVTDARIYTDSLEVERVEDAERALKGKSVTMEKLSVR